MRFLKLTACLFLLNSYSTAIEYINEEEYRYLDQIALEAETDKSSVYHNYTRIYSKYLSVYRKERVKLLELGIRYGASVKLWENYFPHGDLHFIDIDPAQIQYHSAKSHYHFIDQANGAALIKFGIAAGGDFDVIIDDASHLMQPTITSFNSLFPFLKRGGVYIIEDLQTSYWSIYGGNGVPERPLAGPGTALQFIKDLIDEINYTAARTWCSDPNKIPPDLQHTLNHYQKEIESIHFYKGLCLIFKASD